MNKIERQIKTGVELKYCVITNKKFNGNNLMDIYPWAFIFGGQVYCGNILNTLKDGDYDIIQINININDIYLINEIRNILGNRENAITKIIAYYNSTKKELLKLMKNISCFSDKVRKADFICCRNKNISKMMREIISSKIYVVDPPKAFNSNNHNHNSKIETIKKSMLTNLSREIDDERFKYDSLWRRLDLLSASEESGDISYLNQNKNIDILGCNTSHDGGTAYLSKGVLLQSIEAEKDSHCRHALYDDLENKLLELYGKNMVPDIISLIGEYKRYNYYGLHNNVVKLKKRKILGKEYNFYITTHERAHIFNAFGMSPFEQGEPCYALTWEGGIGTFYRIDKNLNITNLGLNFWAPGFKYTIPFTLANNNMNLFDRVFWDSSQAGKTMALAGFASEEVKKDNNLWKDILNKLLDDTQLYPKYKKYDKDLFRMFMELPIYNKGVTSRIFKDFVWKHQNAIFERFYNFAKKNMKENLPLLMTGGCALNCEWNSKWKDSGLFKEVFVPPCANDSGIAIGAAIDAQHYFTGNAKINWNVYAGEEFVMDVTNFQGFDVFDLNYQHIVDFLLKRNNVIAWVQGKYEIGPRALCHRSLIAAPFKKEMLLKLNRIKQRENYRPIAPVCLEEDVHTYFQWERPSPYMLYFQKVLSRDLRAVTHIDGTARVQTVTYEDNEEIYNLLKAFKLRTGFSVLCNTSLNFKGTGFINRMSDLIKYVQERGLDGMVVGNYFYIRKSRFYIRKAMTKFKKLITDFELENK